VLVLIIVIPVIALLILFFINSQTPEPQVNTNVTVQPATPFSENTPVIRQAPPPSPAKAIKQPSMPTPPTVATPGINPNNQVTPKQTAQPLPSESPP
jgi:type IV secretory pathway VirB10-like protein